MTINLRDAVLAALSLLPGTREFHLHVLVSSPRKHAGLFPFALPRPRSYLQDILILLSEQSTPDSPRILVTAVEAFVYHIPSTSCAILYVSKVDSTGQAGSPSPTSTVVRSLLTFYADPTTRPVTAHNLWIHLFARAQAQYLFPNSSEYSGKRPLSDIRLCAWWRRVLSDVAGEWEARVKPKPKIKLYYVLPGYSELEAEHALKLASSAVLASSSWSYGHPYSQSEIPLPCPLGSLEGSKNLGHFIPSFDDDPKSRFMDEIAYTTNGEVQSPVRKRSRTSSYPNEGSHYKPVEEKDSKDNRPLGELAKVSPDEFWERMSFRQECVAGAITGFYTVGIVVPSRGDNNNAPTESPLAPQPGQVSSIINKRIMTLLLSSVEFSTVELSVRATETVENTIRRLCEGIMSTQNQAHRAASPRECTPERETSSQTTLAPPVTPPPKLVHGKRVIPDVSPNPFPEPVTSLETYHSHIYGSICVSNPVVMTEAVKPTVATQEGSGASEPKVTVLTVRKKKKKTE